MDHTPGARHAPQLDVSPQAPFETDRIALAAFLVALGHKSRARLSPSGIVFWTFADPVSEDVRNFYNGAASVDPVDYDAARITVRRMMDAAKGAAR